VRATGEVKNQDLLSKAAAWEWAESRSLDVLGIDGLGYLSAVSALFDVRDPLGFNLFKCLLAFVHLYDLLGRGHIGQARKASGCPETLKRGGVHLVESPAIGTAIHVSFSLFWLRCC
jgi:hypothetical protein